MTKVRSKIFELCLEDPNRAVRITIEPVSPAETQTHAKLATGNIERCIRCMHIDDREIYDAAKLELAALVKAATEGKA